MPADSDVDRASRVTRRALLAGGGGVAFALAGCISTSPEPPGSQVGDGNDGGDEGPVELLKCGGSSTVYPITNTAASYWSANYPPSDEEYWGPGQYGIETDANLADYWAGKYGFEPRSDGPPFEVTVSLSHSGTGLEKLKQGQIHIANASAPVEDELTDLGKKELNKFKNHVVAVDAQPIVVSKEIFEAGVEQLTADQVRKIYTGEIEDWTGIDAYNGPEKEIQAVGRSVGSGTDTAFRSNMLGSPDAEMPGVDVRKGENQQVKTIVANSSNAIAYMALAFVDDSVPAISLEFGDTVYTPGKNLSDPKYPLSRDLHCYTYKGTSKKAAAFLRMILSDFGQETFVKPSGYSTLTKDRQDEELGKLPDTDR